MVDIIIRFAVRDDVDKLMKVFKDHWEANHILAHNKDFFLYMYGGNDKHINMVIGEDRQTGEIEGILGYIKYNTDDYCDFSSVMWINASHNDGFLGLKLMFFLVKNVRHRLFSSIAVLPDVLPIFKHLKYNVGQLEHYYRISDREEYKIAKIVEKKILPIADSGWNILFVSDFDVFKDKINDNLLSTMIPRKDKNYFYHTFFVHPIFHYMVYAIQEKDTEIISAFFVCREVEKEGVKILRIIDYIGEEKYFANLGFSFQTLIDENNYEYIDCYCRGISEKTMNNAGLIKRKETDANIIPDYFEPFYCKNIDIYYFTNTTENFRAFRGDANHDQPRLNDRSLY